MNHTKITVHTIIYIGLSCVLFAGCNSRPSHLEQALTLAGENRAELEKVLEHYASNPNDSLKLKAAKFLIENMPKNYSFKGIELDSFKKSFKAFAARHEYPVNNDAHVRVVPHVYFDDRYSIPNNSYLQKEYDIQVITSEYLIDNIEWAFKVWKEKTWGKSLSFDDFCEDILPYRVGHEPLENWRAKYYEAYKPLLDSLLTSDDPVDAGIILYDTIFNQRWIFDDEVSDKYVGALTLLECRIGDCRLLANYAAYVFRSVGIPSGIDCILQNPDMLFKQHYWNYMKNQSGKTIPFELYQTSPAHKPNAINRKKGKIYRICFGQQKSSIPIKYKKEKIPPLLNDVFLKDVSSSYFEGVTVAVDIEKKNQKGNLLYLSVFNNSTWIPVTCSKIADGKAVFQNVEPGIAWRLLYYHDEQLIPTSVPLITLENGQFDFLKPDTNVLQKMELVRKYPTPGWLQEFKHRSRGGLFQGANKEDFSDAVTLYTTMEDLNMKIHRIPVDNPRKFKYLRYYGAPDAHCDMAEIRFFSHGKELQGEVIGTEGSSNNLITKSKYAVFDKDPVTYFDSPSPDGSWAGLKLSEPEMVTEIEYLFRTDDNNIREGDEYELFYFSDQGLVSMGKQIGDGNNVLIYNHVPSGAMYWLRNLSRGREERIFTYEDGRQAFW